MASITVRNLDDDLKSRLRVQAAVHGRSMEEEVRGILRAALDKKTAPKGNLAASIRAKFAPLGGVDLQEYSRELVRDPPSFEE
jgi:plasmid stability protein